MKDRDREEARRLLYEIDKLSESAILMNNTLDCLKENGGKIKLSVNVCGNETVTELDETTAGIVIRDIITSYNSAIVVCKSNRPASFCPESPPASGRYPHRLSAFLSVAA